jgi:hypothetical protein
MLISLHAGNLIHVRKKTPVRSIVVRNDEGNLNGSTAGPTDCFHSASLLAVFLPFHCTYARERERESVVVMLYVIFPKNFIVTALRGA